MGGARKGLAVVLVDTEVVESPGGTAEASSVAVMAVPRSRVSNSWRFAVLSRLGVTTSAAVRFTSTVRGLRVEQLCFGGR